MDKDGTTFRKRYRGPWRVVEMEESIAVTSRCGVVLARLYPSDLDPIWRTERRLTWPEARALAKAIAKLGRN